MQTRLRRALLFAGLAVALLGPGVLVAGTVFVDAGRGNVLVRVPDSGSPPFPLVVFLHGYNSSGAVGEV